MKYENFEEAARLHKQIQEWEEQLSKFDNPENPMRVVIGNGMENFVHVILDKSSEEKVYYKECSYIVESLKDDISKRIKKLKQRLEQL